MCWRICSQKLQAGNDDTIAQVNEWRDKPFMPHVVARSRPTAYMKWVVMKYIEILIAWGDYLFRQDTIESINQATQLYILASHVYGPRGYKIPKRGKIQPQTYNSLMDRGTHSATPWWSWSWFFRSATRRHFRGE